jgi:hypothetical protein
MASDSNEIFRRILENQESIKDALFNFTISGGFASVTMQHELQAKLESIDRHLAAFREVYHV